jgi:chromosomal replication initiation ATPase DnaA
MDSIERTATVKRIAADNNMAIGSDVAAYIASRVPTTDVTDATLGDESHELEVATIRIIAFASLHKLTLTQGLAEKVLSTIYPAS